MNQLGISGQQTTLIHFTYDDGRWKIACMPGMVEFHETHYHPNYQRSNDSRAVTCPACKKSDIFKRLEQK